MRGLSCASPPRRCRSRARFLPMLKPSLRLFRFRLEFRNLVACSDGANRFTRHLNTTIPRRFHLGTPVPRFLLPYFPVYQSLTRNLRHTCVQLVVHFSQDNRELRAFPGLAQRVSLSQATRPNTI